MYKFLREPIIMFFRNPFTSANCKNLFLPSDSSHSIADLRVYNTSNLYAQNDS